jgi:hypothetical protein
MGSWTNAHMLSFTSRLVRSVIVRRRLHNSSCHLGVESIRCKKGTERRAAPSQFLGLGSVSPAAFARLRASPLHSAQNRRLVTLRCNHDYSRMAARPLHGTRRRTLHRARRRSLHRARRRSIHGPRGWRLYGTRRWCVYRTGRRPLHRTRRWCVYRTGRRPLYRTRRRVLHRTGRWPLHWTRWRCLFRTVQHASSPELAPHPSPSELSGTARVERPCTSSEKCLRSLGAQSRMRGSRRTVSFP